MGDKTTIRMYCYEYPKSRDIHRTKYSETIKNPVNITDIILMRDLLKSKRGELSEEQLHELGFLVHCMSRGIKISNEPMNERVEKWN